MKVVHRNDSADNLVEHTDLIIKAEKLEKSGDLQKAVSAWKKVINVHSLYVPAYQRIMILLRKLKEYKEELRFIEKAIKHFSDHYAVRQTKYSNKIITLSRSLLKATGLGDKKGNNLYERGELTAWKKRREVVRKRMNSRSTKSK